MHLRTLHSVKELYNKTVLLRVDLNVAVGENGRIDPTEDFRIRAVVPTIEYLLKRGATIVLLAHLGRPEGKVVEEMRLAPVAKRLRQLLKSQITNHKSQANSKLQLPKHPLRVTRYALRKLLPSYAIIPDRIWLLENLRFDPREEKNNRTFAKALASLGDIYVNDAFAVSHRKNASVHAITNHLPSYAGLLMGKEVSALSAIFDHPRHPLVVVMGGAKISSKIGLIKKFLPHADHVLLGGALANTLLKVQGYQVGKSLVEDSVIPTVKKLALTDTRLSIPVDVVVAPSRKAKTRITAAAGVRKNEWIYDIGPDTVGLFSRAIRDARMIVWNGPLGLFEEPRFAKSTFAVLHAVIKNKSARVIIGGGETITAFQQFQRASSVKRQTSNVFTSTGGGAMLKFLEQGTLSALKRLIIKQ